MLSFKQYLIEKTEDTKYGGMNVPLDLADFPDNDDGSMISPLNFSGSALNPVKYTRTDRDAYDAALKLKNEKILANNKKYGLSDKIDETPFEKAFDNSRNYIERMVMDPNNQDNEPRSPNTPRMAPPMGLYGPVENKLPALGGKGSLSSILNPDNPLDRQSPHTRTVSAIKNIGSQIAQGFTDFNSWLNRQDHPREMFDSNYDRMKKLNDPLWIAHNEAGEKEARNKRLGVTPSVVNPNPPENYHDSQDYFDRITGIANTSYNAQWYKADEQNRKLSPFDMISLQFGKDKSKDRNDFLEKQKEYLDRYGPKGINHVPWLQSKEAKMARTYADLRDPRYDEEMLYKPLDLKTFTSEHPFSEKIDPPETFLGKTKFKNTELYQRSLVGIMKDIADPNSSQKEVDKSNNENLTIQQAAGRAIDNLVRRVPSTFETQIDMNKDNIQDFDQFIATLGHEGQHAIATPARGLANIENSVSTHLGKDPEYKSPATIKYDVEPSISGLKLGSGYEELENRGILDNWKLTPEQRAIFKTDLEAFDAPIVSPNNRSKTPESYLWSRAEMPAYMTDIKGKMLKLTGSYPKSDQTDEEIEKDRDRMYEIIRQSGPQSDLAKLKALEMMKTPEGKAIYRGVEKSSSKQDRRYA
jgi:hypothetical protein